MRDELLLAWAYGESDANWVARIKRDTGPSAAFQRRDTDAYPVSVAAPCGLTSLTLSRATGAPIRAAGRLRSWEGSNKRRAVGMELGLSEARAAHAFGSDKNRIGTLLMGTDSMGLLSLPESENNGS